MKNYLNLVFYRGEHNFIEFLTYHKHHVFYIGQHRPGD